MTNQSNTSTANDSKAPKAVAGEYAIPTETSRHDIALGILTLTFGDGTTVVVRADKLAPEILSQALMHGLKAKLVDAAAIAKNTDTGKSATVADKKAAVMEVHDRLMAGQWNKTRESGEGNDKGNLLLEALLRMYPNRERGEVIGWMEAQPDTQLTSLRKNPKVAAVIAQIRAERAAKAAEGAGVDLEDLLGGLDGLPEAPM